MPRSGHRAAVFLAAAALAALVSGEAAAVRTTLAPATRAAIARTLDRFVPAAVARLDLPAAYDLATPDMRGGMSRREWARGDISVYPFPARGRHFRGWRILDVERNLVALDVLLQPRRGAKVGPMSYTFTFKRLHGRWLVDSAVPTAIFSPAGAAASVTGQQDFTAGASSALGGGKPLANVWILVPFGVGLLAVVAIVVAVLAGWLRERRARRLDKSPRTLPPSPLARARAGAEPPQG